MATKVCLRLQRKAYGCLSLVVEARRLLHPHKRSLGLPPSLTKQLRPVYGLLDWTELCKNLVFTQKIIYEIMLFRG